MPKQFHKPREIFHEKRGGGRGSQLRRLSSQHSALSTVPFVSINVAMTADGKLAPANRQFIPFTTKRDQDLMLELRAEHDAVMSGAATVIGEVTLGTGGEKY